MATSSAQKKATAKWNKQNIVQRKINFYPDHPDHPDDAACLKWLDAQPKKNEYLLGLIKADMDRR